MIICITGPTGVGKTKLSLRLASILNGEIINADSTQVYKGMDIATAKVKDKEGITHYLMDIKDLDEDYTVYDYQRDCRMYIDKILDSNKVPIIVGGTGLYIKAALYDYRFDTETTSDTFDNISTDDLYKMLISMDADTSIHPNNRKRIIRALNRHKNNSSTFNNGDKLLYDVVFIGLTTQRNILYDNINKRVDDMFKEGLLNEAKGIYDSGIRSKAVMTPIGYKELFPYFKGEKSLNECIELIKQNSRRYAKRQYTWFNNKMDINWFNVDFNNFDNTVKEVLDFINKY